MRFQSTLPRRSDHHPAAPDAVFHISIHAPAKERRLSPAFLRYEKGISIHAPAKERPEAPQEISKTGHFNPRSREGATLLRWQSAARRRFQSTLPRRSDAMRQPCMYSLLYFNPRSREGATCRFCYANKTIVISIHAPAKERPSSQNMRRLRSDFNPRSREGATSMPMLPSSPALYFNPRSREGATMVEM